MTDKPDHPDPTAVCATCRRAVARDATVGLDAVRPTIRELAIQRVGPSEDPDPSICRSCLAELRGEHMRAMLERDRGELSALEEHVLRTAADNVTISAHVDETLRQDLTVGQRLADAVARVGGSWSFVLIFAAVLAVWITINWWLTPAHAFDPFPYILLNLVLSCLAAIQAPIIMMSQNRSAARDRLEADEDFRINLKAELEIASLHEKVDHLIHGQHERIMEAQELQLELLEQLAASHRANRADSRRE